MQIIRKTRAKFIDWHKDLVKTNYIFDFQKEMYKYCAQDVSISSYRPLPGRRK